jgi:hypothetical protein
VVQITQRQNKDDEKLNNDSQITTQMRNVKIEDHENPLTNGVYSVTQLLGNGKFLLHYWYPSCYSC